MQLPPLVESAHWHAVNTREAGLHWLLDLIANVQLDSVHRPTGMSETPVC
jgi:hypothetical protein